MGHKDRVRLLQGIAIFIPSLLLIYCGLIWLLILFLLMFLVYKGIYSFTAVRNNIWIKLLLELLMIIILAVIVRLLVCEIYEIPSKSMESELFEGDNILVSKLNYGPKLPSSPSEVSWLNLFYSSSALSKVVWWPNTRFSGFSKIKRGDIIVFKGVQPDGITLIKRCAGVPADHLMIQDGELFINGKLTQSSSTVMKSYRVWSKKHSEIFRFAEKAGVVLSKIDINVFEISATDATKKTFQSSGFVDSIKLLQDIPQAFPWYPLLQWSGTNFGPVRVPFEGMRITLNMKNYVLYKNLMNDYEDGDILFKDGRFYSGKKVVTQYAFKKNYYFVLGDNRNFSEDSRYWGFLPEQNIKGKAVCILYSYTNHVNWARFFKPL